MDKNQIKELIEKIVAFNIVGPDDYDDAAKALEYMDYYVKIGDERAMFLEEFGGILETHRLGLEAGVEECFLDWTGMNCFLALIKKFFDKQYFEGCLNSPELVEGAV